MRLLGRSCKFTYLRLIMSMIAFVVGAVLSVIRPPRKIGAATKEGKIPVVGKF